MVKVVMEIGLERGFCVALSDFVVMQLQLAHVFFNFSLGTKTHYYGKTLLQHCADCNKLYLAITGDSVLIIFDKARNDLPHSLRRVESIVPQILGERFLKLLKSSREQHLHLNDQKKEVGDEIVALLQQDNDHSNGNDTSEMYAFNQICMEKWLIKVMIHVPKLK